MKHLSGYLAGIIVLLTLMLMPLHNATAIPSEDQTARIEELERLVIDLQTRLETVETVASTAAAPSVVAYQGYLTDAGGAPLDGTHTLRFSIHTAQTGGTQVWTETHTGVPVDNGYFSVLLGSAGTTPLTADKFAGATRWIQVSVDTGSGYTALPRQQLAAVPYALQAASVPWNGVSGKPEVGFTIVPASDYLDLTTEWQDVPGMTATFTLSSAESIYVLVFGAFNQAFGEAPADEGDPQRFRLVVNGETIPSCDETGGAATGSVGVFTRVQACKVELEANGSPHTIQV